MRTQYKSIAIASITLLLLFICWELAVTTLSVAEWILPTPSQIALSLWQNKTEMLPHIAQTMVEVGIGLALAIVLAFAIATLLDYSTLLRRAIYPILILTQTIPIIALAPLLAVWFGFDLAPKIIIVTLFCFFPLAINTSDGLSATDKETMDLFISMAASWWQIWYKLRLPTALPYFLSGLKVAVTYSVMAAVVGEWVGAEQGLGLYLLRSAAAFQTTQVFATIAVISFISLILFATVLILERKLIYWNQHKDTIF